MAELSKKFGVSLETIRRDLFYLEEKGLLSRVHGGAISVSGMLNFFTYVGSAISAYGIAKISEVGGWQATIWTWAAVAAVGCLMCMLCFKKYNTAK